MFPKEQQASGLILTALSLWEMAPSGKNEGCDWRLGKGIPTMPASGAMSERLRLGLRWEACRAAWPWRAPP